MINVNIKTKLKNLKVDANANHVHLQFHSPVETLSSAILNGGYTLVDHILNMRVPKNFDGKKKDFASPNITLQQYADKHKWKGNCVGMMTSAYMETFTHNVIIHNDVVIECFITSGVSNARRAGDPADWKYFKDTQLDPGTINIILGTNAKLSHAAMVEAIMIITEAKAVAMQELNILSPISNKISTGTGTDSVVVFNGCGKEINFCGKHVLFGEMIASVVIKSIKESLEKREQVYI